jgi:AraC family transcriptional regulator
MQHLAASSTAPQGALTEVAPGWTTPKMHMMQLHNPAGAGSCQFEREHTLFVSLSSRPVPYVQKQDGKTFRGIYRPGEILITPAQFPLFVQWDGDEHCLQIQLSVDFFRDIAEEVLGQEGDRRQLIPQFQVCDHPLNSLTMLLANSSPHALGEALYLDSLANALAVHLLRNHTNQKSILPVYTGGLPPRQLQQVLDYIEAHLTHNIQLKDLAQRLGMSQFHFSRLFKQSLGLSPYQYLIQQRIERAQKLLRQGDRPVIDIALDCGFGSHSHFSKQFRQIIGMTPKQYRQMI